jgi:hypothetical protein
MIVDANRHQYVASGVTFREEMTRQERIRTKYGKRFVEFGIQTKQRTNELYRRWVATKMLQEANRIIKDPNYKPARYIFINTDENQDEL